MSYALPLAGMAHHHYSPSILHLNRTTDWLSLWIHKVAQSLGSKIKKRHNICDLQTHLHLERITHKVAVSCCASWSSRDACRLHSSCVRASENGLQVESTEQSLLWNIVFSMHSERMAWPAFSDLVADCSTSQDFLISHPHTVIEVGVDERVTGMVAQPELENWTF